MLKKQFLFVIVLFSFGIIIVSSLYWISRRNDSGKNGFSRTLKPSFIGTKKVLDILYNSYYIAGLSNGHIYLGNYTAPVHILITDYNLADTQHIKMDLPDDLQIAWKSLRTTIYEPNIYTSEQITPFFLTGKINDFKIFPRNLESIKFNASLPISPSCLIVRTFDHELKQNILASVTWDSSKIKRREYVLEKQGDGLFSLDGVFLHDPHTDHFVYLYYYRNQFLRLDTDLNRIYKGNTIDTISKAQIDVVTIASEQRTTFASPPVRVNIKGAISGDKLFVNSGLMADNEDRELFNQMSVIDLYALQDGEYQFSFYLPKHKDEKVKYFKVFDDKLVAIYGQYLVIYDLNKSI